jgi:Protein of unknown function (DUF1559)
VKILPFMEETVLYNQISAASNKFALPAFSPTITAYPVPGAAAGAAQFQTAGQAMNPQPTNATGSVTVPHLSMTQLGPLRCPSYADVNNSTAPPYLTYATSGSTLYYSDATGSTFAGPAISNYVATAASHLACMSFNATATSGGATQATVAEPPNGILIPDTSTTGGKGLNFKSVTDGLSKTIMVTESREPGYSAWYDGSVNWVVGAATNQSTTVSRAQNGLALWTVGGVSGSSGGSSTAGNGQSALNNGPVPNNSNVYMSNSIQTGAAAPLYITGTPPTSASSPQPVWQWGPSSFHSGGVVIHLYGDGAVRNVTDDIDPSTYIQLITRAGQEPVQVPGQDS